MVFCRGCGKEVHETAPTCPHCGFVQIQAPEISKSIWMGVSALVLAVLCCLNWFNLPNWDPDMTRGLWMFSVISMVLGVLSLLQKRGLKVISGISVIVSSITIVILISRSF